MELVIFAGLQGAGKSSFYRARFASTHVCVSKDQFRNNRRPARRQRFLLEEAFQAGRSVVVDNTNPTVEARRELIDLGLRFGATITGYFFESLVPDCLERNRQRTGKARVPDGAILAFAKLLQPPTGEEAFDRLYFVRLVNGAFEVTELPGVPSILEGRGNTPESLELPHDGTV